MGIVTTKLMGLCRNLRTYTAGHTQPATPTETFLGLACKMHEEVQEVINAPKDRSEYADVLQALMDFAELNGIDWLDVEAALDKKAAVSGTFINPPLLWKANTPATKHST